MWEALPAYLAFSFHRRVAAAASLTRLCCSLPEHALRQLSLLTGGPQRADDGAVALCRNPRGEAGRVPAARRRAEGSPDSPLQPPPPALAAASQGALRHGTRRGDSGGPRRPGHLLHLRSHPGGAGAAHHPCRQRHSQNYQRPRRDRRRGRRCRRRRHRRREYHGSRRGEQRRALHSHRAGERAGHAGPPGARPAASAAAGHGDGEHLGAGEHEHRPADAPSGNYPERRGPPGFGPAGQPQPAGPHSWLADTEHRPADPHPLRQPPRRRGAGSLRGARLRRQSLRGPAGAGSCRLPRGRGRPCRQGRFSSGGGRRPAVRREEPRRARRPAADRLRAARRSGESGRRKD